MSTPANGATSITSSKFEYEAAAEAAPCCRCIFCIPAKYSFAPVQVFGVSRYRFHGRFSRLLDVHVQMMKAGCLDDELLHGLEFPRKSGLLEAASMLHTTSDEKVQERG